MNTIRNVSRYEDLTHKEVIDCLYPEIVRTGFILDPAARPRVNYFSSAVIYNMFTRGVIAVPTYESLLRGIFTDVQNTEFVFFTNSEDNFLGLNMSNAQPELIPTVYRQGERNLYGQALLSFCYDMQRDILPTTLVLVDNCCDQFFGNYNFDGTQCYVIAPTSPVYATYLICLAEALTNKNITRVIVVSSTSEAVERLVPQPHEYQKPWYIKALVKLDRFIDAPDVSRVSNFYIADTSQVIFPLMGTTTSFSGIPRIPDAGGIKYNFFMSNHCF